MNPFLKVILIILIIFIVITLVSILVLSFVFSSIFKREDWPEKTALLSYYELPGELNRKKYTFYRGKKRISAYLYGEGNIKGFIVYVHGMVPGHEAYISDIYSLVNRGYEVFTYDLTGTGKSEGRLINGVNAQEFDLYACLKFLETQDEFKYKKILLYGHSMGAYGVSMNINKSDNIKAIVSISGFSRPIKLMQYFITQGKHKLIDLLIYYPIFITTFIRQGIHNNDSAIKEISNSTTPILIIHGTEDEVIGYKEASIIINKDKINNPNAKYIVMDNPNHNKHNSVIASTDCVLYQNQMMDEYKELLKTHKKDEARDIILSRVDKVRNNSANEDLMDIIDDFYQSALRR